MSLPSVDVIVPTRNSARTLEACLAAVGGQAYDGKISLLVVDGGSTDFTVEIARRHGATVLVRPGQYGTGLNGARHLGETVSRSELVWNLDSDNIPTQNTTLRSLAEILVEHPEVQFSIPFLEVDPSSHPLNQWISEFDQYWISRLFRRGTIHQGTSIVDDVDWGLPNATLIRRSALQTAGGYDSDVRLLWRLRRLRLSTGAVVSGAAIHHTQLTSTRDYYRKIVNRLRRFSQSKPEELSEHFVDFPPPRDLSAHLILSLTLSMVSIPFISIGTFVVHRRAYSLWGLVQSQLLAAATVSAIMPHPGDFLRVFKE